MFSVSIFETTTEISVTNVLNSWSLEQCAIAYAKLPQLMHEKYMAEQHRLAAFSAMFSFPPQVPVPIVAEKPEPQSGLRWGDMPVEEVSASLQDFPTLKQGVSTRQTKKNRISTEAAKEDVAKPQKQKSKISPRSRDINDLEEEDVIRNFCGNPKCGCFFVRHTRDSYDQDIDQCRLYIYNIPQDVPWEIARNQLGIPLDGTSAFPTKTIVPSNRDGKCKGIAFMEFADHESAVEACKVLRESDFFGDKISVNFYLNKK